MINSRIILAYGASRFGVAPPPQLEVGSQMSWFALAGWTLPALPLLARIVLLADFKSAVLWRIVLVALGVAVALGTLFLVEWLHLHEKDPATPLDHALVFPIGEKLTAAYRASPAFTKLRLGPLFSLLGPGYTDGARTHSGHSLGLALFLVLMVLYWLGYVFLYPKQNGDNTYFPVLCYILVLIMIFAELTSAVAFFGDRYRWSLVVLIAAYSLTVSFINVDHYYKPAEELSRDGSQNFKTPGEIASRWQSEHKAEDLPMVVVTATGGGIQASAWAAEVLTGLQKDLQQSCGKDFSRSLVLMSSVSGGSVGTMYFAEDIAEKNGTQARVAHDPTCSSLSPESAAIRSSLREAAWGLAYPDLLRFLIPPLAEKTLDRGWALEQGWQRCWSGAQRSLADWADDVAEGRMPAVILNSTVANTGQRFLLTNYQPVGDSGSAPAFATLYPKHDIPIVTAARLSATFPYVGPMTRALITDKNKTFHVADGGYYDNYGVVSAIEWLRQALPVLKDSSSGRSRQVLLIEIESSPEKKSFPADQLEEHYGSQKRWGWPAQTIAPLTTVLNVRTTGQRERSEVELDMYTPPPGFVFKHVQFGFHDEHPPLSWHLTYSQKEAIRNNWRWMGDSVREVKAAFGCGP